MNENDEVTRTFDMSKIAKLVGLDTWTGHDPEHCVSAIDYIMACSDGADTVQIFGSMPTDLAMRIAVHLSRTVDRLEWSPYNGRRNVIFSLESE